MFLKFLSRHINFAAKWVFLRAKNMGMIFLCVWSTNISVSSQVRYFMEALRGRVQSHPEANVTRQNTKKRKGKEVVV